MNYAWACHFVCGVVFLFDFPCVSLFCLLVNSFYVLRVLGMGWGERGKLVELGES